ncbi:MAG: hypothetical protein WBA98_00895 [Gordonia sp. (in: high G+C Gram-positive bacteria)]|uniref:hypothetical protein n=1 Tax=Gordonia sp. (in: high G+C Gram-positive bacteria) TaxID=84139 RepID=UPI003C7566F2
MDEHGLIWRTLALDSGVSEAKMNRAIRQQWILPVGRGVYVRAKDLPEDPGERKRELFRRRSLAAAIGLERNAPDGGRTLSHQSAASLLGLQLLLPDLGTIHITNGRSAGGKLIEGRMVHAGLLDEDDVTVVGGVRVTSLARTAVDVALSLSDFAQILTVFDSALRAGVAREELERRLMGPRHGVAAARHALAYANGLSDNPGESWSRAQIIECGLPVPILQSKYELRDGAIVFCDYDWEGKAVGEFDGFKKYRRTLLKPGTDPEDAVTAEKIREDKLRDLGLGVIRWWWEHLVTRTLEAHLRQNLPRWGVVL